MEDFISFLSQSSPALVSALIPYLSHPGEKKFYGMVLDRVFLSCENSVVTKYDTKVRQLALKGARRQPGKQWPPGIDDVFIGEVAALFLRKSFNSANLPDTTAYPAFFHAFTTTRSLPNEIPFQRIHVRQR